MSPIEGDALRDSSDRESPQHGAIACPQLANIVALAVHDPCVGPVKGHVRGKVPPRTKRPKQGTIAHSQFAYVTGTGTRRYPHMLAIESQVIGRRDPKRRG